ncbi:hypothetical protein DV736_g4965, partial [Chaetothyriales sp. CBS 134916]
MLENTLYMYLLSEQELAIKRAAYDHIPNLSADFHDSKTSSYKEQFRTRDQAIQDINIAIWWYNEGSSTVRYSLIALAFAAACCLLLGSIDGVSVTTGGEINRTSEKLVRAEMHFVLLEKKLQVLQDDETAEHFKFLGGEVEFDNVYFSYDGTRQGSEGISLRTPAGSTTALVGETGGGKSTTLKLLFRFHDPRQGQALIDGQHVRKLQLQSFRKHIGWVPRTVGERSIKLSGGERQRLAIARIILKAPDILFLDEATNAVDSITDAQIQVSLEKLGKLKTTFVIAHRLSTIMKADQILIKLNGVYKKLWDSQLKLQQAGVAGVKTEEGSQHQHHQP